MGGMWTAAAGWSSEGEREGSGGRGPLLRLHSRDHLSSRLNSHSAHRTEASLSPALPSAPSCSPRSSPPPCLGAVAVDAERRSQSCRKAKSVAAASASITRGRSEESSSCPNPAGRSHSRCSSGRRRRVTAAAASSPTDRSSSSAVHTADSVGAVVELS